MPAEFYGAQGASPQSSRPARKPFELKGVHVLAIIVTFFAVVAAVNATMMTVAIRTMPGLDARNGYDVSQGYNREIAAARAQNERAWRADAQITLKGEVAHVSVALTDHDGRALPAAIVTARLKHPTDKRRDLQLSLAGRASVFEAEAAGVSEGFWDLVIEVRDTADGPARFVSRQRIRLRG